MGRKYPHWKKIQSLRADFWIQLPLPTLQDLYQRMTPHLKIEVKSIKIGAKEKHQIIA